MLEKKDINTLVVKGFAHTKGAHCESKSLQDMLNWAGFPVTEPLVFGLDATLGFTFIDRSAGTMAMADDFAGELPFFVGGKQGTITAQSLACRILGASIEEQTFISADKAWVAAQAYLAKGQPLAILVDMYHLPYHSTFHQFHFGRHAVVLAGWDPASDDALIADVEFSDILAMPVPDLKKARGSTSGGKYMAPHNTQFAITRRADGKHPPLAAGAKLAIQQTVKNMLAASMNYHGVQALDHFAKNISSWKDFIHGEHPDNILQMLYGYIEEYGTGGAAFRNLFRSFLQEILEHSEVTGKDAPRAWNSEEVLLVKNVLPSLSEDITVWHDFAGMLKQAADKGKAECMSYLNLEDLASQVRQIARLERAIFGQLSKLKI